MSESERPWQGRRLHFVGVGGAGMSGYARAAHALGASVSGSDRASTPYLESLAREGVLDAHIGHDASNVPSGADVELVHSSAVPAENPERLAARGRGLRDRPRADLLSELTALRRTIAVAGAHGKTTTSSMIVHILRAAGVDPGWLVGSSVGAGLANSHWSAGEWLVVEADESDRSMLSLHVDVAVLTNVELDHHATFASLAELREAFREFLARATRAIVIWERPELLELAWGLTPSTTVDGPPAGAPSAPLEARGEVEIVPYDLADPRPCDGGSVFQWHGHEVMVGVPGAHNALNATGALEASVRAGADEQRAVAALASFSGAARRFQLLGTTARGARVYDDYAHHPTEVAATISAARTLAPKRLVAVFQPHLYSRTALLAEEFGEALAQADVIALLDVYPARERAEDHPGVSGLTLVRAIAAHAGDRPVLWLESLERAEHELPALLDDGDLCLVMGAGDVDALAHRLVRDS
ncbi:MAG: UDP-N-acetylmuramate--L-alanine ligase [Solirubrobacteraceae bacterium]